MSWNKITIKPADRLFSNFIREQAGFRCQKCGKLCKVGNEWIGRLEASHYFSRGHGNTRFDPQNVYSLCSACHKRMGGYTNKEDGEYDLWVKSLLGSDYEKLRIRAYAYHRKDDKMDLLIVKALTSGAEEGKSTVC